MRRCLLKTQMAPRTGVKRVVRQRRITQADEQVETFAQRHDGPGGRGGIDVAQADRVEVRIIDPGRTGEKRPDLALVDVLDGDVAGQALERTRQRRVGRAVVEALILRAELEIDLAEKQEAMVVIDGELRFVERTVGALRRAAKLLFAEGRRADVGGLLLEDVERDLVVAVLGGDDGDRGIVPSAVLLLMASGVAARTAAGKRAANTSGSNRPRRNTRGTAGKHGVKLCRKERARTSAKKRMKDEG